MKMIESKESKKVIPVFYATDENYLPYLTVSLSSLKENANKSYLYKIYILHAGMEEKKSEEVLKYQTDTFRIYFVNVAERLEKIKTSLQLRDYYTGATYYRVFIAGMFPQFEKAIYLDSDTVVLGDISELFAVDLKNNLVGAVADGAVASVPQFKLYTKAVLGICANKYFNAGILLMNLAQFRKEGFYKKFCMLLKEYKFRVAQDQDYLNVLCYGKVTFLNENWNKMPIGGRSEELPKIVHYNLTLKPWHYTDILYQEYFWAYAQKCAYYDEILSELENYSEEKRKRDIEAEKNLISLAVKEASRKDNFIRARRNRKTA